MRRLAKFADYVEITGIHSTYIFDLNFNSTPQLKTHQMTWRIAKTHTHKHTALLLNNISCEDGGTQLWHRTINVNLSTIRSGLFHRSTSMSMPQTHEADSQDTAYMRILIGCFLWPTDEFWYSALPHAPAPTITFAMILKFKPTRLLIKWLCRFLTHKNENSFPATRGSMKLFWHTFFFLLFEVCAGIF